MPIGQPPYRFELLPDQTFATFEVLHFGTSTIRGRLGPVSGTVVLDPVGKRSEVGLRINTASVNTGIGFFDARLRQADLLAVEEFPEAYFVSRNFVFQNGVLVAVVGEFTFRGVSQSLTLQAKRFGCWQQPLLQTSGVVCGGDFEGEVLRSRFGATFGLPLVADTVKLVVQVAARQL